MVKLNMLKDEKLMKTKFVDWVVERGTALQMILASIQFIFQMALYITIMIAAWKYILS